MGPLEPFDGELVDEKMGSGMEDVGGKKFRRGRKKKSAGKNCYL